MDLHRQYRSAGGSAELLAAETSKELLPAPGANKKLCVRSLFVSVLVSAAQTVSIQSATGGVVLAKIAATPGITQFTVDLPGGVDLPDNTALNIVPAAAGPSVFVRACAVIKG